MTREEFLDGVLVPPEGTVTIRKERGDDAPHVESTLHPMLALWLVSCAMEDMTWALMHTGDKLELSRKEEDVRGMLAGLAETVGDAIMERSKEEAHDEDA